MSWTILLGDARGILATLPASSVQCCVTSPPYWGLRDYGVDGQIGAEPTPDAYVAALVSVFRDVRRVLKDDGVLWLNLGDSYCNAGSRNNGIGLDGQRRGGMEGSNGTWADSRDKYGDKRHALREHGIKHKDLIGIPWRVAFALQADGWYLRADIIWSKANPMPESVTDRPTKSHEYIFLLTKSSRYYYDADAIREPNTPDMLRRAEAGHTRGAHGKLDDSRQDAETLRGRAAMALTTNGANCRSVWSMPTQSFPEAHFATFPEAIPERCIKAGSRPSDVVLDPFCGAGTTGLVADRLGRDFIGIELNPAYREIARRRLIEVAPLFNGETVGGTHVD